MDGILREAIERHVRQKMAEREAEHEVLVREAADRYLLSLHTGFWSRGFDIHHPEGRAQAVEHIVRTFRGIAKELEPRL